MIHSMMKVFGSNSLSTFFYYATKLGFCVLIFFLIGMLFFLGLGFLSNWMDWDNSLVSLSIDPSFHLEILPLDLSVRGEQNLPSFVPILILGTLSFYVATLFVLVRLFKSFMSEKIFSEDVAKYLNWLSILFFVAAILSFVMVLGSPHSDADVFSGILLLVVALLLFFIQEVFRQGLLIQSENDLTI